MFLLQMSVACPHLENSAILSYVTYTFTKNIAGYRIEGLVIFKDPVPLLLFLPYKLLKENDMKQVRKQH